MKQRVREFYTDGSVKPTNPGWGGWAFTEDLGNGEWRDFSGGYTWSTNNQMEMEALIECLSYFSSGDKEDKATIYCDSMYCINGTVLWSDYWVKSNWKKGTVKNIDRWKIIRSLYLPIKDRVKLRHVKGHSGVEGNERVDVLAGKAAQQKYSDNYL